MYLGLSAVVFNQVMTMKDKEVLECILDSIIRPDWSSLLEDRTEMPDHCQVLDL